MTLSLIVPVFNSFDLVWALLNHVSDLKLAAAESGLELVEVILSDDGSAAPLTAPAVVADVSVRVLRSDVNCGKGHAVRVAALAAKGDFVLMSDADESTPLTEIVRLVSACASDVALVCGSRRVGTGAADVVGVPWHRRFLSRLFNVFVHLAGIRGIYDTQCGFKLFRMAMLRPILASLVVDRFAFDVELIVKARRAGHRVVETAVAWQGGRRSSVCVIKDAPRMLFDLCRIACS